MDNITLAIIILLGSLALFLLYLFLMEKFHKQEKGHRKVLLRDVFGSPVHTIFVVGDGMILVSMLNIFDGLSKEQSYVLLSVGVLIVLLGVILYRFLVRWFEKDPDTPERNREF